LIVCKPHVQQGERASHGQVICPHHSQGGKTLLLASRIVQADLAALTAWAPVQGGERDPQRFWLSVLGALRETTAGSKLVRPLMDAQGRR
jgi:LuxR family maltose regulon positive regulatory protein